MYNPGDRVYWPHGRVPYGVIQDDPDYVVFYMTPGDEADFTCTVASCRDNLVAGWPGDPVNGEALILANMYTSYYADRVPETRAQQDALLLAREVVRWHSTN